MYPATEKRSSWLDRPLFSAKAITWETIIFAVILILAIATRFYKLEPRVMSHDETSHVYFSWLLYTGQGYQHDPVTHGPFQFHIVALSYFLFGDSDTAARIPAVLFSIASVGFIWFYRRYLGRAGTIVTALLFVISPYMLYYGRYVRNESFVAFFGLLTLWAVLRYLETGKSQYILWLTASIVLHYTSKETSYIYVAQLLLFLALLFIYRVTGRNWPDKTARSQFLISLMVALGSGALFIILKLVDRLMKASQEAGPQVPGQTPNGIPSVVMFIPIILLGLALVAAIYFLVTGKSRETAGPNDALNFGWSLLAIVILVASSVAYGFFVSLNQTVMQMLGQASAEAPAVAGAVVAQDGLRTGLNIFLLLLVPILIGAGLLFAGRYVMRLPNQVWPVGSERSFDLIIVLGTLILPTLAAFLIDIPGDPLDYSILGMVKTAGVLIPLVMLAIGVGWGWNLKIWLPNAALFYGIFVVLYTTVFTNGNGFFTGIVGSLGYWLQQQSVERGTQPWYYYILVQVPIYEYLPALGSLLALVFVAVRYIRRHWTTIVRFFSHRRLADAEPVDLPVKTEADLVQASEITDEPGGIQPTPVLALFGFWAITSIAAYSYAGEKMPWLTVHIALPLILLAGWAIGEMIEKINFRELHERRGLLVAAVAAVFLVSFAGVMSSLLGPNRPFQGKDLAQLMSTGTFITSLVTMALSGWGLFYLVRDWFASQFFQLVGVMIFAFLAVLTARAAFNASYINYDRATEYLVYAHCGPGIKDALSQIEELSQRTTGALAMTVAYDNDTTYPYWWYLRDYTAQKYYDKNATRDLRDSPVILVGQNNFAKIEPVVAQNYQKFEYIRIWWPDEDYKNLTWERIWNAVSNAEMRNAIFQIWLNRDYTEYARLTGRDMSLQNWTPSEHFRLYIRKDIVAQLWNYGATVAPLEMVKDPYEGKQIQLAPDKIIGTSGAEPGQFNGPRNVAVAPDGTLYVADTFNHRIQHLAADGTVLNVWGSFSNVESGLAPGGTFNEPWGIAVGPDGSVYVADTWNHRVQKFTSDGTFVTMWGSGIIQDLADPFGYYGPRAIAVDASGNVYLTDTGNKRVLQFNSDGQFLMQFGDAGMGTGQFDEPVGLALSNEGQIYVADTWNQRVQVFGANEFGQYIPQGEWEIYGWFGQLVDNKPYLAVNSVGHVFVADPEGYRILEFDAEGKIVRYWGDYGNDPTGLNLPTGIAVDADGGLWVADAGSNRIVHYTLPPIVPPPDAQPVDNVPGE